MYTIKDIKTIEYFKILSNINIDTNKTVDNYNNNNNNLLYTVYSERQFQFLKRGIK